MTASLSAADSSVGESIVLASLIGHLQLGLSTIKLQERCLCAQNKFFIRDRRKFDLQGPTQNGGRDLLFLHVRQLLERSNQTLCGSSHNIFLFAIQNQVTR